MGCAVAGGCIKTASRSVGVQLLLHHARLHFLGSDGTLHRALRDGQLDRLDESVGSLRVSIEVITASRQRLSQPNMLRAKAQEAMRSAALMLRAPCAVAATA
jgi:hypothetical protein